MSKKPRVITFLSGKGGSGKTTVAIAIAKLLADMGHGVMLVDFDLATNGGSYFFKKNFAPDSKGIWEVLSREDGPLVKYSAVIDRTLAIPVSKDFWFVPSRVHLNTKGPSYDAIPYEKDALEIAILRPMITMAEVKLELEYVLIDCQAGYSISSAAAAEVSDMAIIVTEADAISSDAADNLLIQLGSSLPNERRYLVNKIDIRDSETYRNMRNVFQSLNRLPPLPFDFKVRNAFGARQIPIDINTPSPLLFALLETSKYLFTEIFEEFETYKTLHESTLFDRFDQQFQTLVEEKRELEEQRGSLGPLKLPDDWDIERLMRYVLPVVATGFVALASSSLLSEVFPSIAWLWTSWNRVAILITVLIVIIAGVTSFVFVLISQRKARELATAANQRRYYDISEQISRIDKQLDQVRSLHLSQSREFLIDAAVVKAGDEKLGR